MHPARHRDRGRAEQDGNLALTLENGHASSPPATGSAPRRTVVARDLADFAGGEPHLPGRRLDHEAAVGIDRHRPPGAVRLPGDVGTDRHADAPVLVDTPGIGTAFRPAQYPIGPCGRHRHRQVGAGVGGQEGAHTVRRVGPMQVDSEAGDHHAAGRLGQDAAQLRPGRRVDDVVGPLQGDLDTGGRGQRTRRGETGDQRQPGPRLRPPGGPERKRGRQRPGGIDPVAAAPPPAPGLPGRHHQQRGASIAQSGTRLVLGRADGVQGDGVVGCSQLEPSLAERYGRSGHYPRWE